MRRLFAPLPRATLPVFLALALVLFGLAALAFRYPLSYCDSPGWAPNYLADLIGQKLPHAASARGWPVTAFLGALGKVATRFYVPNFIGYAEAALLFVAVVMLVRIPLGGATRAALVLAPAFLASALRHAIYSQTVLSEALAVFLVACLARLLLAAEFGLRDAALGGALAALLASIRIDLAYFAPLLLVRPFVGPAPDAGRGRATGAFALAFALAWLAIAAGDRVVGKDPHPTGRILALAEWTTITSPPRNAAARSLRTPLADTLASAAAAGRFRTFEDAMPVARVVAERPGAGWPGVARLVLYDLANDPARTLGHRLAVLRDLVASSYAAFWPGYAARSAYYSRYAAVFAGWSLDELDGGRYSPCTFMTVAQRDYFHATGLSHPGLAGFLLALHRVVTPYAVFVWRPLVWLAWPAFLLLGIRRRVTRTTGWLAAVLAAHFLLRALLVCADERYELPADLLFLGWIALVVPAAIAAVLPAGNAASPRR